MRVAVVPMSGQQIKDLCERAWYFSDDDDTQTSKLIRQYEKMADTNEATAGSLSDAQLGSMLRKEAPRDVEELITRLNTYGGVCYMEHAQMIRKFFRDHHG